MAWKFYFTCNLSDKGVLELQNFLARLELIHLHFQIPEFRYWIYRGYTCKSFFEYLVKHHTSSQSHIANLFWRAPVLSKVKVFTWASMPPRFNSNQMVQIQRPNCALSPDICTICFGEQKTVPFSSPFQGYLEALN